MGPSTVGHAKEFSRPADGTQGRIEEGIRLPEPALYYPLSDFVRSVAERRSAETGETAW